VFCVVVSRDGYKTKQLPTDPRETDLEVRSEVFTAVTMKNGVFWDIEPSSYLKEDTLRLRFRAQPVNAM
jgi:hypothetical protein